MNVVHQALFSRRLFFLPYLSRIQFGMLECVETQEYGAYPKNVPKNKIESSFYCSYNIIFHMNLSV